MANPLYFPALTVREAGAKRLQSLRGLPRTVCFQLYERKHGPGSAKTLKAIFNEACLR
jgi:hypothetical protein